MQFVDLIAQHDSHKPALSEAVARVIRASAFIRGSDVEVSERRYLEPTGLEHCMSCAVRTDVLYIAARDVGASASEEVITAAPRLDSTSETITRPAARVVLC